MFPLIAGVVYYFMLWIAIDVGGYIVGENAMIYFYADSDIDIVIVIVFYFFYVHIPRLWVYGARL